jgi:hypothetical protein
VDGTQTPFTAKQPAVRLMPFAAVEVAEPVRLRASAWRPEEKVEVAEAVEVRTPVLEMEKSVVVADAVEEPMAKRVVAVSPLLLCIESLAYGEEVPMPRAPEVGSWNVVAVVVAGMVPYMKLARLN